MDTAAENEIQATMASTVTVQNGYTNGITNGISNQDLDSVSGTKQESKSSVISSSAKCTTSFPVQGSMLRKDIFYPYQKSMYMSPSYNLSSDSKRMVRRLQDPLFAASPGTVHLVYEVGGLMTEILLKNLSLFRYAYPGMLSADSNVLLYDCNALKNHLSNVFASDFRELLKDRLK